jgi:hypothetical protein
LVWGEDAVGVPEIVPLLVSNVRPAGRVRSIDQVTTTPPLLAGVMFPASGTFCVRFQEVGLYEMFGTTSRTVNLTVVETRPSALAAVTV